MNTKALKSSESGQALLLIVLLLALGVTVVSAVSFRLTTDVQVTKTQEDSVRALAAADAGIERGIQVSNAGGATAVAYETAPQTFESAGINLTGINATESNILISNRSQFLLFESPDTGKDEQFTFYLGNYPSYSTYFTGNLVFRFATNGAGSCNGIRNRPALEVTIIYGANSNQVEKILYEPCSSGDQIGGSFSASKIQPAQLAESLALNGFTNTYNFNTAANPINISTYPNAKILIVRTLFASTRVRFEGSQFLPTQGKIIRSEAHTNSGVNKIVTLYQSLPQIPADFFVTAF